jgi:ABC-2 type transport system ATP-binding protein
VCGATVTGVSGLAVEVSGLTRAFGELRAVDGIELSIPAGSFYGLAGPNGAGRTTAIRMIAGLLQPDAGAIAVDGVSVWPDPREAKRRLGFVPDNPSCSTG